MKALNDIRYQRQVVELLIKKEDVLFWAERASARPTLGFLGRHGDPHRLRSSSVKTWMNRGTVIQYGFVFLDGWVLILTLWLCFLRCFGVQVGTPACLYLRVSPHFCRGIFSWRMGQHAWCAVLFLFLTVCSRCPACVSIGRYRLFDLGYFWCRRSYSP